jgi:hypothetical protein
VHFPRQPRTGARRRDTPPAPPQGCAQKARERQLRAEAGLRHRQVEVGGEGDHAIDSARIFGQRRITIVSSLAHAEHRRQVCPGRPPVGGDALRVDAVVSGVGAHPAYGTLHVVELDWPRVVGPDIDER